MSRSRPCAPTASTCRATFSGYIRTGHSREEIELRGADASHAWVAGWCGEAAGWVQLELTNDLVAKEDHVAVAWGWRSPPMCSSLLWRDPGRRVRISMASR